MIRYFFRLLKGYVRIQIKSISPEYFLERCRINGIFFWELVCLKKGEYQCSLFLKDFYRLRGCARGKGVRLRICERRGLPFFLQRNRKRWYAAAGLSSFFLLLYIMSLFIWDIHFQGNHHYTADTLVRYLDTQDVRYGMKKKKINSNNLLLLITIVLFFVMYAAGCIVYADKGFTRFQTFLNILINNAGLICITAGMTCVMLTGGIDISVGSLVAMDCMILAVGIEQWGWSSPVLMLLILAIGIIFGIVQGFCISYLEIQPFIVTMAGMFFARGMTAVICKEQVSIVSDKIFTTLSSFKISLPFGGYLNKKGIMQFPYLRVTVVVALIVVIAIYLMLKYTRFGRSIYAVGGNQQSATLMGLDVKKTQMKAYILSSFLTSIGGICYCLNTMAGTTTQATGLEMDAISSAVIGGTLLTGGVGNVLGSLFGVLINGTISTLVKTNGKLISSWSNIVTAILLCFFIVLQSVFALVKERKSK